MGPFCCRRRARRPFHGRVTAGFTLIEMLVVLAIIGIVSLIVITGQTNFNRTIILSNTAYDIALTMRDTETYGLGSRAASAPNAGYGIHFDAGLTGSFFTFPDIDPPAASKNISYCNPPRDPSAPDAHPGDCYYTTKDQPTQTYTIGNHVSIGKFCITADGTTWSCSPNVLSTLDITFARPNPNVTIVANGSYSPFTLPITQACITLVSPQGDERFVSVTQSGLITASVNPPAAACQ